jgi:hypothetical protein
VLSLPKPNRVRQVITDEHGHPNVSPVHPDP